MSRKIAWLLLTGVLILGMVLTSCKTTTTTTSTGTTVTGTATSTQTATQNGAGNQYGDCHHRGNNGQEFPGTA